MKPYQSFSSSAVAMVVRDIDTDQIIPARFLKVTDKAGLGHKLLNDWRYDATGAPLAGFVLNDPDLQGAEILVAGDNFGCGSSREHAPWALVDWGFRAVVSTGFAEIFRNNALKNGLLPVEISAAAHDDLCAQLAADKTAPIGVDLSSQRLTLPDGETAEFPIESFAKKCLLEGLDQLGYLLRFASAISAYEAKP